MRELLVAVPSRGRPQNVVRLWKSMQATCGGDTQLLIGVDADDPFLSEYMALELPGVELDVNRRGLVGVVAVLNYLAVPRTEAYRYIGHVGDDQICRSALWDVRVAKTLAELGTGMCFGDDLYGLRARGTLPCHVFLSSSIIAALGYMGPPSFQSMYVDNVWALWGQTVGLRFLPDVILEHLHPGVGKAELDQTYQRSHGLMAEGAAAFNTYVTEGLQADVAKLQSLIAGG